MKIVSPDILHKSDSGGIRLNVSGDEQVSLAYDDIFSTVRRSQPDAHLEGLLLEEMAPKGYEVIVGMRRDPSFGPMLMFGLGGIYVELFADVAFRIAPVSEDEALAMLNETKAGKLLAGFRGAKKADIKAIISCIQRIGRLALDFETIEEMEVNPLVVYEEGNGALALDCRIILGGS